MVINFNYPYDSIYTSSLTAVPLIEEEMQKQFSFVGWNFTDTWAFDRVSGYNYPILKVFSKSITGITPGKTKGSVVLYPNPVVDVLYIRTSSVEMQQVRIYNLSGMLIYSGRTDQVNMSAYVPGIYIVDVEGVKTKVIKQ